MKNKVISIVAYMVAAILFLMTFGFFLVGITERAPTVFVLGISLAILGWGFLRIGLHKPKNGVVLTLIIIGFIIPVFVSFEMSMQSTQIQSSAASTTAVYGHVVEYTVTGNVETVDYEYWNTTGGQNQSSKLPLPIDVKLNNAPNGMSLILNANSNDGRGGTLTCSIYVDGKLLQSSTSTRDNYASCQVLGGILK